MRFTISAAAFAAFVSAVLAQTADFDPITKPLKDEKIPAGSTYQVEWQVATQYLGPVTLSLLGGATPGTLVPLGSIGAADNADGKFTWNVDSALGDKATYGIQITLDADKTIFQYSMPFHITGGGTSTHSNSTASGTATYTLSSMTSDSVTDYPTMTPSGNYTATRPPPKTTITQTQGGGGGGSGGSPTQTGATVPTSGAGVVAAPFALLGAALAALAL